MSVHDWLHAHKPSASRCTHLLLAAILWSAVGLGLVVFGTRWVLQAEHRYVPAALIAAAAIGAIKSELVLRRTANRIVERIQLRGEGYCIGGFLSVGSWAVVAAMVGLGRWVRHTSAPRFAVGLLYVAVGTALLLASRHAWRAWRHTRPAAT